MSKSLTVARKTEIIDELTRLGVVPGATIFTILRSVSRSGMNRKIDLFIMKEGEPLRITWKVAELTGYTYDRKSEALSVNGCGMDMGFDVVYNLGWAMFGHGVPCAGKGKCQSNDHNNPGPDRDDYSPEILHKGGGYALKQKWI